MQIPSWPNNHSVVFPFPPPLLTIFPHLLPASGRPGGRPGGMQCPLVTAYLCPFPASPLPPPAPRQLRHAALGQGRCVQVLSPTHGQSYLDGPHPTPNHPSLAARRVPVSCRPAARCPGRPCHQPTASPAPVPPTHPHPLPCHIPAARGPARGRRRPVAPPPVFPSRPASPLPQACTPHLFYAYPHLLPASSGTLHVSGAVSR